MDKNRAPRSLIAAWQHAALLTIDTARHGLRDVAGAIDCLADNDALVSRLHINRFSRRNRIVPAVVRYLATFPCGPLGGQ